MFSEDEIEALVLGSRWVSERGDSQLGAAARNALAKIAAVLPADLRNGLDSSTLIVPRKPEAAGDSELTTIRHAIRAERKMRIRYSDGEGAETRRTIWPFAVGFFERARVVVAWCEMRESFRHFRTDRILGLTMSETRYPRRRLVLMKEWRDVQGIALDKSGRA
jgi:predicted DNA-binding transcriptional regulator YafY